MFASLAGKLLCGGLACRAGSFLPTSDQGKLGALGAWRVTLFFSVGILVQGRSGMYFTEVGGERGSVMMVERGST